MKKCFITLLLISISIVYGQTAYTLSTSGTLVASGGDLTSCIVTKNAGALPSITAVCKPGNGGPVANLSLSQVTGASGAATFQVGDIVCMIGMNATAASVTIGSLGSIAPFNAVLSCSVNVRGAGPATPITGNVQVPQQTLVWP
jgi:hypothetical protein